MNAKNILRRSVASKSDHKSELPPGPPAGELVLTPAAEWQGPVHPGRILKDEFLIPDGLTQKGLANATGLDEQSISEIIRGERAITPNTSVKLGDYLEVSGRFFLDLQVEYDYSRYLGRIGRSEIPPSGAVPRDNPVALDNAAARSLFLADFPCSTPGDWQGTCEGAPDDLLLWVACDRVFMVEHERKAYFPAFQFDGGLPLPAIGAVLAVLPRYMSSWQVAFWFVSGNGWLEGAAPVDRLDDEAALVSAAHREGEAVFG